MMRPLAARRCGYAALRHQERRAGVGREHPVPLLDGDVLQGLGLEDAGIVDEEVEPAELLDDRGHRLLMLFRVAQIAADGRRIDIVRRQRAHGLFRFGLRVEISDGTSAPRSASASAMARPMRLAAPVTSAVFP